MKRNLSYTEEQIRESGLLTPERLAEVLAAAEARMSPAFDAQGRAIKNTCIVDYGDGHRELWPRQDSEHMSCMARRDAIATSLTDDEYQRIKDHCFEAYQRKKEEHRFEKAEKLTTWDGWVYYGDKYFPSLEELFDHLASVCDSEEDWPEYVWAARPTVVIGKFDAWEICESYVSDNGWEDMSENDLHGLPELQADLDRFTAANASVVSYLPDYKKAVLIAARGKEVTI